MRQIVTALCLFAAPVAAEEACPAATDHSAAQAALIADLQTAPSEAEARALSGELWALWTDAPDQRAQELLNRGMALREVYAFLEARDLFDRLVEYCPDYAEGYNQRAFASFLRRDFEAALRDLDKVLELNPQHIGALSGKALTLMGLGREDEGQETLRAALALNPWLAERALLDEPPGVPL